MRLASGVIALFLCAAVAASAQTMSVEARARERGEAFGEAMMGGEAALLSFAREHAAPSGLSEQRAKAFAARIQETLVELGPVDRYQVQVSPNARVVFVFCRHTKTGAWQNYQFRVASDDAHRLQLAFRAVAVEPMERPRTPLDHPESQRWMTRFLTALEAQQPFSGVAAVRQKGKEIFTLEKGVADTTREIKVTRNTRFGMASGSKMFTAIAVLQLAQTGKLSLDDLLIRHLPTFENPEFAKRATVHQLLTHTAGAGNYWDADYEKARDTITDAKQMLPFVMAHLGDTPSGEYSYSNSGFFLLGMVIEAASGQTYHDYVQKNILSPAGMHSTGFPTRAEGGTRYAVPYNPEMEAGQVKPGVYLPVMRGEGRGTAAGGGVTTVDDLLHFADALAKGVLLDKAHLELMTKAHVPFSPDSYGYGLILDRKLDVLSYGHGGTAPGTQFEFRIFPALDTVLVVMSNYNTIAGNEIASALDELIRQTPATAK